MLNVGHTLDFDDTVAWLATRCSKAAVTELMRVDAAEWIARVVAATAG